MYTCIIAGTIKICNIDRYSPIVGEPSTSSSSTYERDIHKYA